MEANQSPSVRALNDASNAAVGMNTSFTADSPYFNSYVDKEIDNLSVLKSTLQDISKNARAFGQCGAAMVEATRNLSSSCKLQSKIHDINEDELDLEMRMERARLYRLKKECMGDEMLQVLSLLGGVLDEIADAQLQMCMSLQASLCEPLDAFAEEDIPEAYRYRNEANSVTDTSEKHFSRYLHGSDPTAQAPVQGNPLTSPTQMGGGGGWRDFRNMKSAINQRLAGGKGGGENNAVNRQNSGNSDVGGADANLRQIRCGLANAELSRFQLLRYLDSLKTRRDYELGESTLASLHGIRAYFHHCSDLTQGLAPRFNALQEAQSKSREKLEKQQRPWEAQQRCLNIIIGEFEKSRANADGYDPNQTVYAIEKDVGIWTLPRQLADASVYQRQPENGIVIEGWLYKKSSARISINTWSRRWFIVDETSIYYLKREGMMGGAFSNSSPERVKVCDIVLCTVRDVQPKGDLGNRFCFEIMSANNRPFLLQACGPQDQELWVNSIRKCIEKNLGKTYAENNDVPLTQRASSSSTSTPQWSPYGDATANRIVSDAEDHLNVKNPITRAVLENNRFCADCGKEYPDWVSLNLCVLICIECSGIHRSLGVHVSKVRSMKMDKLSATEAQMLLVTGNDTCNSIYEAGVRDQSGWEKPKPTATRREREEWIKSKYVWKGFLKYEKASGDGDHGEQFWNIKLYDAAIRGDIIDLIDALVHGGAVDWKNKDDGGKTALHACAIGGPALESDVEVAPTDSSDSNDWSGLECAEYLIQNGAKLDAQDDDHQNVLDCAVCRGGRIDMVEYLHSRMS